MGKNRVDTSGAQGRFSYVFLSSTTPTLPYILLFTVTLVLRQVAATAATTIGFPHEAETRLSRGRVFAGDEGEVLRGWELDRLVERNGVSTMSCFIYFFVNQSALQTPLPTDKNFRRKLDSATQFRQYKSKDPM